MAPAAVASSQTGSDKYADKYSVKFQVRDDPPLVGTEPTNARIRQ